MNLKVIPKKIFRILLGIIAFLSLGNIIANLIKFSAYSEKLRLVILFFDVDLEKNLPTFYSSLALLFSSILVLLISMYYRRRKEKYLSWLGISLVFAFLALDEFSLIHEQLWAPTHELLDTTGILYYAWYIPYGIILLILAIVYAKWFIRLPKKTKKLFFLAGFIFISGAIGLEAISGYYDERYGIENFYYCLFYSLEELCEMVGVAVFIYALLLYISEEIKVIELKISK